MICRTKEKLTLFYNSKPKPKPPAPLKKDTHLFLVDDVDARLDVREGVRRRQDAFAFVLFVQVAVGSAVQCEGSTVHEGTQVVVLVKVGDSLLELVRVEEWFNVGDLEVGLKGAQTVPSLTAHFSFKIAVSNGLNRSAKVTRSCHQRKRLIYHVTLLGSSLFLSTGLESLIISTISSPNLSE